MNRKYEGIGQVDKQKLDANIKILECAIGECDSIIPSEVLQDVIDCLELLSYERSWYGCSEDMGR